MSNIKTLTRTVCIALFLIAISLATTHSKHNIIALAQVSTPSSSSATLVDTQTETTPTQTSPWIAKLHIHNPTHPEQELWCSGTLIDEEWVITTASCVTEPMEDGVWQEIAGITVDVLLGTNQEQSTQEHTQIIPIQWDNVFVYKSWLTSTQPSSADNIALLHLPEPANTTNPTIAVINIIAPDNHLDTPGASAIATAWSTPSTQEQHPSETHMVRIQQTIVPTTTCQVAENTVPETMLCASTPTTNTVASTSQTLPGAALVSMQKNIPILLGITNTPLSTSDQSQHAIAYTSIAHYRTSIESTLAVQCPNGQFRAEYFNNRNLAGEPVTTRCEDSAIHKNWQRQAPPDTAVEPEAFSVRWTGNFWFDASPSSTPSYYVRTWTDDGVRIMIDGTPIIDHWHDNPARIYQGKFAIEQSGLHEVVIEFYENKHIALLQVVWFQKCSLLKDCSTLTSDTSNTELSAIGEEIPPNSAQQQYIDLVYAEDTDDESLPALPTSTWGTGKPEALGPDGWVDQVEDTRAFVPGKPVATRTCYLPLVVAR